MLLHLVFISLIWCIDCGHFGDTFGVNNVVSEVGYNTNHQQQNHRGYEAYQGYDPYTNSYDHGHGLSDSFNHQEESFDHYERPNYEFKYNVEDQHTGDKKSQYEYREGDVVRGSYSLVEPDGSVRTVEYTADPHRGFSAVVHRTGHESVSYGH